MAGGLSGVSDRDRQFSVGRSTTVWSAQRWSWAREGSAMVDDAAGRNGETKRTDGRSPSGKAPVFGTGIRRFEPFPPSTI